MALLTHAINMEARYVKTEAGRAEMKERRLALPRQARLLLVTIDASKSSAEWVAAVGPRPPYLPR